MIKKKICLMGSFGVGKTSLVRKYVFNIFSDSYLASVGAKVDKKLVALESGLEVTLLIWDLEGHDDYVSVADTYLRGMSGYILVADGTSLVSFETACGMRENMERLFPGASAVLMLNKVDLEREWVLDRKHLEDRRVRGLAPIQSSAKTGVGVEEAFFALTQDMVRIHDDAR